MTRLRVLVLAVIAVPLSVFLYARLPQKDAYWIDNVQLSESAAVLQRLLGPPSVQPGPNSEFLIWNYANLKIKLVNSEVEAIEGNTLNSAYGRVFQVGDPIQKVHKVLGEGQEDSGKLRFDCTYPDQSGPMSKVEYEQAKLIVSHDGKVVKGISLVKVRRN